MNKRRQCVAFLVMGAAFVFSYPMCAELYAQK